MGQRKQSILKINHTLYDEQPYLSVVGIYHAGEVKYTLIVVDNISKGYTHNVDSSERVEPHRLEELFYYDVERMVEDVGEEVFIIVEDWYENYRSKIPFSFYVARKGYDLSCYCKKIRTKYVISLTGFVPIFNIVEACRIRKRRVRKIQ